MDNSGAFGHDLLTDPDRKFIAEVTVPSSKVVIAGPLTLRQCHNCDPTVEKAFIARLPIASDSNTITVHGQDYKRWGFAVALINWNELVKRSGVYDVFEAEDLEFQLTRTDRIHSVDSDTFTQQVCTNDTVATSPSSLLRILSQHTIRSFV
jgi:sensor domain CHASE-containing protein